MRVFFLFLLLALNTNLLAQEPEVSKEDLEALIKALKEESNKLDSEIESIDKSIQQHDELIEQTDKNIERIDSILENTPKLQKIPLLSPTLNTPPNPEDIQKARSSYINREITWWFENELRSNLEHQVFVSYMTQVEGIKTEQIPNFSESFKRTLWQNFREDQREHMLNTLVSSTLDLSKIAKHHIGQAWDSAMHAYIKKHNLETRGLNPGFSLYNY